LEQSGKYKVPRWKIIVEETKHIPFYIDDGTGRVLINPDSLSNFNLPLLHKFEDLPSLFCPVKYPDNCVGKKQELQGFGIGEKIYCHGYISAENDLILSNEEPVIFSNESEKTIQINSIFAFIFTTVLTIVSGYTFIWLLYQYFTAS